MKIIHFFSSAQDALGMLETFHSTETRAAIKSVIDSKFEVVIRELLEEILEAKRTFLNDKDVPPLLRDQPRDAGAIFWCRGLFNRLKRSVVQFKKCDRVQQSAPLKEAFSQYVQLVRHMKVYQDDVFANWNVKTEKIISVAMSSHLIRVIKKRDEKHQSNFKCFPQYSFIFLHEMKNVNHSH
jgi:Dynein heavy chain, N-terminal region 1